jgi:beta-galactosidase
MAVRYGAAWYPEQWPEQRWAVDLAMMRDAGMNVARIGEFAWSRMEPSEGVLDLDWLRRAIEEADRHGIAIVLGTPTAAPPAWLTQRYPDVLAVDERGSAARHGARCHYRVTSPRYREFCRRIASALAEAFGKHPAVIGWQIDNEYWRISYDPESVRCFQRFLREGYGTLDALNAAWTTRYWSQTYSDWSQIPLPTAWDNPCLVQAMRRFFTQAYREYQHVQIEAIRKHAGTRQWITHNAHAHPWLDWVALGQDLDLASWDPYLGGDHLDAECFGMVSDLCRNIRPGRKHWIMETQPGRVSWARVNSDLHRGETRNLVWHFVGHGADAVLFWQWRSPYGGQEHYHGTIVDAAGRPRPVFEEIARTGRELARVAPLLDGKRPVAQVAMIHRYPDRWALMEQRQHADFDPIACLHDYYAGLRSRGVTVDVVDPAFVSVEPYRLVIAPWLHLLDDPTASKLTSFVKGGGHLLLGARSGFKDEHNALLPSRQPGDRLAELLGASVSEYYALAEPATLEGRLGAGSCKVWAEPLDVVAEDAEVLLSFGPQNAWMAGKPAVVSRKCGDGRITYCGAWPEPGVMGALVRWAAAEARVRVPEIAPPKGVTLHELADADGAVCVLNNCTDTARSVALPVTMRDVLTDRTWEGVVELEPRGVAVLMGVRPSLR